VTKYSIQHDYTAAHDSGSRKLSAIKLIVLHDMESTNAGGAAEGTGAWFERAASQGSTHYGVDNNSIQRYLDLTRISWGAPSVNTNGVHIEQMGKASWTRKQWLDKAAGTLDRTAWLIARLHKRLGIPIRRLTDAELRAGKQGVTTHRQCSRVFGGTHTDPGTGYPFDHVLERAKEHARAMD